MKGKSLILVMFVLVVMVIAAVRPVFTVSAQGDVPADTTVIGDGEVTADDLALIQEFIELAQSTNDGYERVLAMLAAVVVLVVAAEVLLNRGKHADLTRTILDLAAVVANLTATPVDNEIIDKLRQPKQTPPAEPSPFARDDAPQTGVYKVVKATPLDDE